MTTTAQTTPIAVVTGRRGVGRWNRVRMWALPTSLVLLTAAVRIVNLIGSPQRVDDEGTYVAQAYAVLQLGSLAHYTYWYDHPPLGWLQIAGWFLLIGGPHSSIDAIVAGRAFMVVVAVITAILIWILSRRVGLSTVAAAAAVTIFALSPLAISLGRMVYLDNIAMAWVLAALVLFCSPQQRLAAALGGSVCFGVAVLTKETMLLLLPMVLMMAWTRSARETRRYTMAVTATVIGLILTGYVLFAAVRNELFPGPDHVSLVDAIRFQLWGRAGGGSVFESGTLNQHTVLRWWELDPLLMGLAVPVALAGWYVHALRPLTLGMLILVGAVLRQGYLPVPFVIAVIPLVAILAAGIADAAYRATVAHGEPAPGRHAIGTSGRESAASAALRRGSVLLVVIAFAATAALVSGPSLTRALTVDEDASIRQAEQWIHDNVPMGDRLIVDDAMWTNLVQAGRDRRDVVWFYKTDTDVEVQSWAPRGRKDYDWVIVTASIRSDTPADGVVADAIAHSAPVAAFGAGATSVEVRHIGSTEPVGDTAGIGDQLAIRLGDRAAPAAAETLRTAPVDPRILASLAVLSTRLPFGIIGLPSIPAEDLVGSPRRQVQFAANEVDRAALIEFFSAQVAPFAPDAIRELPDGLLVRFPPEPLPAESLSNQAPPIAPAGGDVAPTSGYMRVAEMRPTAGPHIIDIFDTSGGPVGSIPVGGYGSVGEYRELPAGSYVLASRVSPTAPSVVRQRITVRPGESHTFTLFTGADGPESANTQFVGDMAADPPIGTGLVRLAVATPDVGPLRMTLTDPGFGSEGMVLADGVSYGLVTGYAQIPAGQVVVTVQAGERIWDLTAPVPDGGRATMMLLGGGDGVPELRVQPDAIGPVGGPDPMW